MIHWRSLFTLLLLAWLILALSEPVCLGQGWPEAGHVCRVAQSATHGYLWPLLLGCHFVVSLIPQRHGGGH